MSYCILHCHDVHFTSVQVAVSTPFAISKMQLNWAELMLQIVCKQQGLGRPISFPFFVTQLLGLESGSTTSGNVVGSLIIASLQITRRICRLRNFKNRLRFDNRITAMRLVSPFILEHGVNVSVASVLFCSLAVLDPRVGHTVDVLSPFISVLCHSDWLFRGESCPHLDVVHPGRAVAAKLVNRP